MNYSRKSILFSKAAYLETLAPKTCDKIISLLDTLRDNQKPWCFVKRTGVPNSTFTSFNFSFHKSFSHWGYEYSDLLNAFNSLLRIYKKYGLQVPYNTLQEKDQISYDYPYHCLPLIFEYDNPGSFCWHAHAPYYSKFQLVCNLTKPGRDYKEALFEVAFNKNKSWKFSAENCPQGSIFSFPYSFAHRLMQVCPINLPDFKQRHIHLLMPIAPLEPFKNGFIPLTGWSEIPLEGTLIAEDLRNQTGDKWLGVHL